MTDTTTITVTVEIGGREYVRQVEGTHWTRGPEGRLYVYDDDDTTLLEVAGEHVVEVLREDDVETIAMPDTTTTDADTTTEGD